MVHLFFSTLTQHTKTWRGSCWGVNWVAKDLRELLQPRKSSKWPSKLQRVFSIFTERNLFIKTLQLEIVCKYLLQFHQFIILLQKDGTFKLETWFLKYNLKFFFFFRVDDNLRVQITDNALSRDLFPQDYHCLGDNENRPIKWLAIESLLSDSFTAASDVVSKISQFNKDLSNWKKFL